MLIEKFEDIESWQEARKLTREVYQISGGERFARDFALKDQMRRAAISVMANIAEGFGRKSTAEFTRFLNIAQASTLELQSHLYVALDTEYINKKQFDSLYKTAKSVSRLIGGFINHLENRKTETPKHRNTE